MIDGMAVDCGSAAGTSCNYADPFAYQEINYQVGNASAENMKGGIIYNMITRTGTNRVPWRVHVFRCAHQAAVEQHHIGASRRTCWRASPPGSWR